MSAVGTSRPTLAAYAWMTALGVLASSAVAVVVPALAADLRLGTSQAGWILAAFSVTFPVGTVLFGKLADVHGQRRAWMLGVLLFVGGTIITAAGPQLWVVIAGRLLQGLGAGAIPTLTLARVASRGDPRHRSRRVGLITSVVSVTSGTGPLLGGALASLVHWRAALALPLLALPVVSRVHRDLSRRPGTGGHLDLLGAVLTLGAIGGVLVALQGVSTGLSAGHRLVSLAGLGFLAGLTWHVRRRPEGFLRADLLRDPTLLTSSLAAMALLAVHLGSVFAVPLILAEARGWSPLRIGMAVLPAAVIGVVATQLVPPITRATSARAVTSATALLSITGVALIATSSSLVALIGGLAMTAAGSLGGQVVHTTAVLRDEDDPQAASAVGTFQLFLFSGGALGPVIVGTVADIATLRVGVASLAVLSACGLIRTRAHPPGRERSGARPVTG